MRYDLFVAVDAFQRVFLRSFLTVACREKLMVSSKDVQRLFLQAVFSRGVISVKLAQALWAKSIEAVKAADESLDIAYSGERAAWEAFVTNVNNALNHLDFEFAHLQDEITGRDMYALVNRKGDEIAQMATDYTPFEIAYFKAIVEQIMLAPRECYSISSMAALREVTMLKSKSNMSKTQAEVVLGSFVANGWLLKSKRGRYSLSTRTLMELNPYLKSTYPGEYVECTICMDIMTRGIACHTPNCKTRLHYHCFSNFRKNHHTCPTCSANWPREAREKPLIPVGEDAVREGEDFKRRNRKSAEDEEEEDEDEDDDDDEQPQARAKPGNQRNKGKGKDKGKAANNNMEIDDDEEAATAQD